MKSFTISAVVLALASRALSQDITSLPQCAQSPILEAISASGCPLTDIACICANEGFINGLVELIPTLCNADEVAVTADFAVTLCGSYGVDVNFPTSAASGAPSISAPASTSPTAAEATTSAPAATGTESDTAATTSASDLATPSSSAAEPSTDGASSAETPSSTDTTDASASASESSIVAQYTDGAAMADAIGSLKLLGVAVGLLAAL